MSFGDYNLRNCHVSQPVMINPDPQADTQSTPQPSSMQEISEETGAKEKIEVIKMKDFTAVDSDEKLNLLMVAINKINTNFHHKFKELSDQLNDPEKGIV